MTVRERELWREGEPLRVARLKAGIAHIFAGAGLEQPRGNIVAPGGEGGVPHSSGTPERVLRAGETLVVDLFPRGGLFADCTRTFCVGEPPERVAAAHAAVREALQLAHAAARPGARGWDLQVAVCEAFTARGYPTPLSEPGTLQGYVHGLGHGVGFELHEFPSFKRHAESEGLLEVGDVLTLEPGLYDPDPAHRLRHPPRGPRLPGRGGAGEPHPAAVRARSARLGLSVAAAIRAARFG